MRIFCNVGWRRFSETLRRQPVVRLVCTALDWVFFLFEANLKKLLETGVQFDAQLPPNFNLPQAKKQARGGPSQMAVPALLFTPGNLQSKLCDVVAFQNAVLPTTDDHLFHAKILLQQCVLHSGRAAGFAWACPPRAK